MQILYHSFYISQANVFYVYIKISYVSYRLLTSRYQCDIILISDTERKVIRNERDNTYQEKKRSSVGDNLHSVPCSDRRRCGDGGLFRHGQGGSLDRGVRSRAYRAPLSRHGHAEGYAGPASHRRRLSCRHGGACLRLHRA